MEFLARLVEEQRGRKRVDVQVGETLVIDDHLLDAAQDGMVRSLGYRLEDGVGTLRVPADPQHPLAPENGRPQVPVTEGVAGGVQTEDRLASFVVLQNLVVGTGPFGNVIPFLLRIAATGVDDEQIRVSEVVQGLWLRAPHLHLVTTLGQDLGDGLGGRVEVVDVVGVTPSPRQNENVSHRISFLILSRPKGSH